MEFHQRLFSIMMKQAYRRLTSKLGFLYTYVRTILIEKGSR